MRKVKHFASDTAISYTSTDYPIHSKRVQTAVLDQQVPQSQLAEHVTIDYSPSAGRVRAKHMYEQIELTPDEEDPIPSLADQRFSEPANLVASVKRSNRWSPGIQKHLKDRVKYDQSRHKGTEKTRAGMDSDTSSLGRRKSGSSYGGSSHSRRGSNENMNPHQLQHMTSSSNLRTTQVIKHVPMNDSQARAEKTPGSKDSSSQHMGVSSVDNTAKYVDIYTAKYNSYLDTQLSIIAI